MAVAEQELGRERTTRRGRVAPAKLIVFDLDGTLVESRQDLAESVNRVRHDFGLASLDQATIVGMIREGVRNLMRQALRDAPAPVDLDRACERFMTHYRELCVRATYAYPGVPAMLATLSSRFALALLSNKPKEMVDRLLERLGLAGWFRLVVGGDSLPVRKPDPRTIEHLAEALGLSSSAVIVVGDTDTDADTARRAGCDFVLVEWGFTTPEDLAGIPATYRVGDVETLATTLMSRAH